MFKIVKNEFAIQDNKLKYGTQGCSVYNGISGSKLHPVLLLGY